MNLTGRLLTIYGQGQGRAGQPAKHTTHSLQLWFTRFALLVKLGQYDLCQFESEPFGSLTRPDIYFEVNRLTVCVTITDTSVKYTNVLSVLSGNVSESKGFHGFIFLSFTIG